MTKRQQGKGRRVEWRHSTISSYPPNASQVGVGVGHRCPFNFDSVSRIVHEKLIQFLCSFTLRSAALHSCRVSPIGHALIRPSRAITSHHQCLLKLVRVWELNSFTECLVRIEIECNMKPYNQQKKENN